MISTLASQLDFTDLFIHSTMQGRFLFSCSSISIYVSESKLGWFYFKSLADCIFISRWLVKHHPWKLLVIICGKLFSLMYYWLLICNKHISFFRLKFRMSSYLVIFESFRKSTYKFFFIFAFGEYLSFPFSLHSLSDCFWIRYCYYSSSSLCCFNEMLQHLRLL